MTATRVPSYPSPDNGEVIDITHSADDIRALYELGARFRRFILTWNEGKGGYDKDTFGGDGLDHPCDLDEALNWSGPGRMLGVVPGELGCVVHDVDRGGEAARDAVVEQLGEPLLVCPTSRNDNFHVWHRTSETTITSPAWGSKPGSSKPGGERRGSRAMAIVWDLPGLLAALTTEASADISLNAADLERFDTHFASSGNKGGRDRRHGGRPRKKPVHVRNRNNALKALLKTIDGVRPVEDEDTWRKVGMALRLEFADERQGWELFDHWSRGGKDGPVPTNYDEKRNRARWRSFKTEGDGLITFASIIQMAVAHDPTFQREYETVELTELAVSKRWIENHGDPFAFITDNSGRRGTWARWNGHCFEEEGARLLVTKLIRDELQEIGNGVGDMRRRTAIQAKRYAVAIEGFVSEELAYLRSRFDLGEEVLNTPDSIINLETFAAQPHDRPRPFLKATTKSPDPDADCPRWTEFLETCQPDPDMRSFLQRLAGYSLLGHNREHALVFIIGEGGNGKGVFTEAWAGVLGNYAGLVHRTAFLAGRNENHPTAMADLHGLRLALVSEVPAGAVWDEDAVKKATGDATLKARKMGQDFFEFPVSFLPVVVGNHEPTLRDVGDSMKRRLHIVPFEAVTFKSDPVDSERQADKELSRRLKEEYPAIMHWILEGLRQYLEEGLAPPEQVKEKTAAYFEQQDTVGEFIREECWLVADAVTAAQVLHNRYQEWMNEQGRKPLSRNNFAKAVLTRERRDQGVDYEKTRRGRFYTGIQTNPPVRAVGPLGEMLERDARHTQEAAEADPVAHDKPF